jgi:CPA2 family monovalent cation:H+ antiporter-2
MITSISLEEFILFLATITVVAIAANFLRLPTIVAFIISGVVVGPSGLSLIKSPPNASFMAEVVAIFLMFTIGLEFSFRKLKTLKKEFILLGAFQVLITIGIVAGLSHAFLERAWSQSLFFGFLVALSSTALVLKLLYEHREMETPYGRNSIGILLFQDVAVIPMMLSLSILAGAGNVDSGALISASVWLLKAAGAIGGLILISRFGIPQFMERVARTGSREIFFFFVLFACFGVGYVFHHFGLSLSLGAFAAGVAISESPYGRQATAEILPLRNNFLVLLFAMIGMLLDLSFLFDHLASILTLGATLLIIKLLVTIGVCLFWKTPVRFALITGLSVCQIGEFSFILASRGLDLNLIDATDHQYFLSTSILSMLFTPFFFKIAPKITATSVEGWNALALHAPFRKLKLIESLETSHRLETAESRPSHAILIGFGVANQNLAAAFRALDLPFEVIEANYSTVKQFQKEGHSIHFGDATDVEILEHCGIDSANLVVVAVSGSSICPRIVEAVRSLRPDVQIIVRTQYIQSAAAFKNAENIEVVIAEIETSTELLSRSLVAYGVDSKDIHDYMAQTKRQLHTFADITNRLEGPSLNLPSWEAIGSISPLHLTGDFFCIERSLQELDLRNQTGASIVSVYRTPSGNMIPDADFVLLADDVIHLVGKPTAVAEAKDFLKNGTIG